MRIFKLVVTKAQNVLPQEKLAVARQIILNKCDFIIDIGANDGQWISSVRKRGFKGPALCIEPIKHYYKLLNTIKLMNTETLNCAIGNFNGHANINVASNNGLSSSILDLELHHKLAAPEIKYVAKEKIQVIKLSKILDKLKYNNIFIKIDTQGYEYEALKSIKKTNFENIFAFEIEVNLVRTYKKAVFFEDVVRFLRKKGFQPLRLENGFGMPNYGQQLQVDILFIKS